MSELTQVEADTLLAMEKRKTNEEIHRLSSSRLTISLESFDKKEQFFLDIWRGSINLRKGKFQNRARQIVVLARLDFEGSPHRNPDGMEVQCPHLHLFKEGFGDKWAIPLPARFSAPDDPQKLLEDFLKFCNISDPPIFDAELFT